MSKMFKPKINTQTPAAPPPPPKIEAPNRELGGEQPRDGEALRKKRGRSALRIDLHARSKGKTGLNVPVK